MDSSMQKRIEHLLKENLHLRKQVELLTRILELEFKRRKHLDNMAAVHPPADHTR